MGKYRLSDTKSLTSIPKEENETRSISTRKISNGFLVTETYSNSSTGEYRCSERFDGAAPEIEKPAANPLRDAVDYMKDDRAGRARGY